MAWNISTLGIFRWTLRSALKCFSEPSWVRAFDSIFWAVLRGSTNIGRVGGLHGGVESGLGHTSAMATQCGALYGFRTAPERRESASASAYVYVWLYVHTSHNTPVYVYFQCYLMCCQRIDCKPLMGSKLDIFKVLKKNGTGPEVNPHELYAYPVSMKAPTA